MRRHFFLLTIFSIALVFLVSGCQEKPEGPQYAPPDPADTSNPEAPSLCVQCQAKSFDACQSSPECADAFDDNGRSCCIQE